MMGFDRRIGWGAAVVALVLAGSAAAQEDLDSGKTPAQLYAANCAICHQTPNGLSKRFGPLGLQPFLREHYTASRQAAAAIAAYVTAIDRGAPPPERGAKRAGKPKEAGKPGDAKASKSKSEAKGSEPAAPEAKPAEAKPNDAVPAETKPVEAKAEAAKPAAKPPAEAKPDSNKPASEKKSD